jgi:hypothetical protein
MNIDDEKRSGHLVDLKRGGEKHLTVTCLEQEVMGLFFSLSFLLLLLLPTWLGRVDVVQWKV